MGEDRLRPGEEYRGGAKSSDRRGSNASGAAGGTGSKGKAHPKTGVNGVQANQAKRDGLEAPREFSLLILLFQDTVIIISKA